MNKHASTILSIVTALVLVGISWGAMTARMDAQAAALKDEADARRAVDVQCRAEILLIANKVESDRQKWNDTRETMGRIEERLSTVQRTVESMDRRQRTGTAAGNHN